MQIVIWTLKFANSNLDTEVLTTTKASENTNIKNGTHEGPFMYHRGTTVKGRGQTTETDLSEPGFY